MLLFERRGMRAEVKPVTDREALIALNLVSDIGSRRLKALSASFGTFQDIFSATCAQLISAGAGGTSAQRISSFKEDILREEISAAAGLGVRIVTCLEPEYPVNLTSIPGYPLVLYIRGEIGDEDRFAVAVVGSRRASLYGLSCAERFSYSLAASGWCVVSGMARGIDTQAHKGALKAKGRTIAVMGSGFADVYPPENRELADEIASRGAVVSEFPLSTAPLKHNFPRRNRIISGLSLGVLAVEAARNSGALITVDFALEQGREVFAIPGRVDSDNARGTNALIQQGAKTVCSPEDVTAELPVPGPRRQAEDGKDNRGEENIPAEEAAVLAAIAGSRSHREEITLKTGLSAVRAAELLLSLQMKKKIGSLPGGYYTRI